jgi:hypothetical protein
MTTSTPATGWHADDALLASYVRGDAGAALGSSIEAHLLHCAGCRDRIRPLVDPAPLRDVWARLEESVQAPRVGLFHRLLCCWRPHRRCARPGSGAPPWLSPSPQLQPQVAGRAARCCS